jgi:hypothetical protein
VETEVVQEIFDEAAAYAPCFSLNLWDAAGHAIQPAPVCLPSIKASEFVRILDGPNAGTAGQGGSVAAQDGGGCSTVPGRSTARWPLVMFVVAVSLCWRPPRSRAARTSPPQRAG